MQDQPHTPPDANDPTIAVPPKSPSPVGERKPGQPASPELSAEEQMENFARELKENDWGHQPC